MGTSSSSHAGCGSLNNLRACFQGFDGDIIANTSCAWRFARLVTNYSLEDRDKSFGAVIPSSSSFITGGCIAEPACDTWFFDWSKQTQYDPITDDYILLRATSNCLEVSQYRSVIIFLLLLACGIFLITFIRPSACCYRFVSREKAYADGRQSAIRRRNQLKCRGTLSAAVSLFVVFVMVICSIIISFSDAENIALLPLFAILVLGVENLFVMSAIRERFFRSWLDNDRWIKFFLLLPATIILCFELLFACVCFVQILANLEIVAVQIIAWFDFVFTLNFTLVSLIIRNPHLEHAPRKLELAVNIIWSCGLLIVLLLMTLHTCSEEEYASESVSYNQYHKCERRIQAYAYTVAFVSIARSVCLATADRFVLFICPDRRENSYHQKKGKGGNGEEHGKDEDEDEILLIEGVDAFQRYHENRIKTIYHPSVEPERKNAENGVDIGEGSEGKSAEKKMNDAKNNSAIISLSVPLMDS